MSHPVSDAVRAGMDSLHDSVAEVAERLENVKPRLRGWLHLATAPLTLAAGIVLITLSAIYHTGTWSPRVWAFLRRFDHANIFILIAGTYTPFSLLLLD